MDEQVEEKASGYVAWEGGKERKRKGRNERIVHERETG